MCKYCDNDYDGLTAGASLIRKRMKLLGAEVDLDLSITDRNMLTLGSVFKYSDYTLLSKKKIKYCPMCGRELKQEDNQK